MIPLFSRTGGAVFSLLALLALPLRALGTYSGNLVISEFLASNSNSIADEDGSKEDWIEIHNPTVAAVNLNGWYLTDSATDLKKWKFPAVTIPSKGYLVVFASDKNRKVVTKPLHTNFKLSADGEYLGLVKPDGVTVVWSYAPTFPAQLQNVSYGVTPIPGAETPLVKADATADVLIPAAAPATDWKLPTYTPDGSWISGQSGIGYDDTPPPFGAAKILYVGALQANGSATAGDQSVINRLSSVMGHQVTLIDDDAVVASDATGKDLVIVSSSVNATSVNTKLQLVPVPVINWERALTDDFLLTGTGNTMTSQTDLSVTTLGQTHPLGGGFPSGPLTVRTSSGTFNTAANSSVAPGVKVIATASSTGGTPEAPVVTTLPVILAVEKGQMLRSSTIAPAARIHTFLADDGLTPLSASGIALFDACITHALKDFVPQSLYDPLIKTEVGAAMKGNANSAMMRYTFTPESVAEFESLTLRMKYDDGFVVWLNGTEVARRNAPASLAWNSLATAHRSGADGLVTETFDLTAYLGLLQPGQANVLAIQGLNASADDDNFLIVPELVGGGEVLPYQQFYTIVTPGAANNTSTLGIVPEVAFSADRGYFDSAFQLELSNSMPEAQIRYTTDGSPPTATTGTIYAGPITISTTAVVRAAAFRSGYSTGRPETRTYLYLQDIIHQPANISGWPNPTIPVGVGSRVHDYEMDPEIVNDPAYSADLIAGMKEIPTMSIVVTKSDMWTSVGGSGFYRGDDLKKPASVEFINPADPTENVQADCSVEGHSHDRMKRSLRLGFSSSYGESKFESTIFRKGPLAAGGGNTRIDNIVLRAGNNHSFARTWNPTRSTFTEDEWYRSTQIAMGGPGSPGRFVHLFINGIYWGLYNPVERPDANFAAETYGGEKDNWFSVNHGGSHGGDATRWNYLTTTLVGKNMAVAANYQELSEFVDLPEFVDYLLAAWYTGMNDWPVNNWWGGMSNVPEGPFRFFCWDGEVSWGTGSNSNLTGWVHPAFRVGTADLSSPAAKIWHAARVNPDFLALVADRLNKHISQGGALSTEKAVARWDAVNDHIRKAIVAESARWGDTIQEPPVRRDVEWQAEVTRIRNLMMTGTVDGSGTTGNSTLLRNFMRGQGYFPNIDAPLFSQEGGPITETFTLQITNPNANGTIYYTIDGSDPRLPGGALHPDAVAYAGPITIPYTLEVKARVKNGNVWSAVNARTFVSGVLPPLRVTELMYNPSAPTAVEQADGYEDNELFEFLEIQNVGTEGIDLSGAHFTSGLSFTFGPRILEAGETILLVKDQGAFASRYGAAIPVTGIYEGSLDNSGERIRLKSASGETLIDFTYQPDWHATANGGGYSLVARDLAADPDAWNTADGWRPSTDLNGSPGIPDPDPPGGGVIEPLTFGEWQELHFSAVDLEDPETSGEDGDPDHDGLVNLLEYGIGTDPKVASLPYAAALGETSLVRGLPLLERGAPVVTFARRKGADEVGVTITPMFSADLGTWQPAAGPVTILSDDGEIEVVSVPLPEDAGEGAPCFFHLEVLQEQ